MAEEASRTASAQDRPVCWGILGASRFAALKSVPGMQKAPSVHVKSVASRTREKARAMADELGIEEALEGYDTLLRHPQIEAVYIPLPNHLHVPWALAALTAGKHVLCEKPIALAAADLRPLLAAQARSGLLVAEAFMVRHHPQWQAARSLVRSGRIGDVRAIHCAFSYTNTDPGNIRNQAEIGGGALYDIGCYAVNTARYVLGEEPRRVVATANLDPQFGVDRLTSGLIDFGATHVTFTVGTQHVPHQRVDIVGTTGRMQIEIPFNAPPEHMCRLHVDPGHDVHGANTETITFPAVDQYALQAEAFSRAIRGESAHLDNDLVDAYRNALVMDALRESIGSAAWTEVLR